MWLASGIYGRTSSQGLLRKQELEIPRNQGGYFSLLGTLVLNLIYTILSIFLEKSRNCHTVSYECEWILTDFHITMEEELSSPKAFWICTLKTAQANTVLSQTSLPQVYNSWDSNSESQKIALCMVFFM